MFKRSVFAVAVLAASSSVFAMGPTSPLEPPYALTIRSMDELLPGANANLDHVCDAILGARQVLLPRGAARQ